MIPCGHQLLIVFAICPPFDSSSDFWFSTSDIQIVLVTINRINTVSNMAFNRIRNNFGYQIFQNCFNIYLLVTMYNYSTHLLPIGLGLVIVVLFRTDIVHFVPAGPDTATLMSTAAQCSGTRHRTLTDTNIAIWAQGRGKAG